MRYWLLCITTSLLCAVPTYTVADEAEESPDLEMLEYLGEWQSDDDPWLDPVGMHLSGLFEILQNTDQKRTEEKRQPTR